jgi:hypothetical protein
MHPDPQLVRRLERLERSQRRLRLMTSVVGLALLTVGLLAAQSEPQSEPKVLRARGLVLEDAEGRERIVLGAPMPDGRQYFGMKILSSDGAEQFGLGLKPDGSVGMGFDTKLGVGDPRNRERLNMGVTATGQGWIRFLDNRTRARLRIALDSLDVPAVQFLDWPDGQRILVRQLGFPRDTVLEWRR